MSKKQAFAVAKNKTKKEKPAAKAAVCRMRQPANHDILATWQ
jgi:hypothetical protein